MKPEAMDSRPRIYIEANRDGESVTWKRHPSAKGNHERSISAAIDTALEEIGHAPAVIFWEPKPPG